MKAQLLTWIHTAPNTLARLIATDFALTLFCAVAVFCYSISWLPPQCSLLKNLVGQVRVWGVSSIPCTQTVLTHMPKHRMDDGLALILLSINLYVSAVYGHSYKICELCLQMFLRMTATGYQFGKYQFTYK